MPSNTTYGVRQLYGGAMTVELPVELIDSSEIRQIPDHQEVFLSPTTLTSIIFEINTYVHATPGGGAALDTPTNGGAGGPSTQTRTSVGADGSTTTTTTTSTASTTIISANGVSHHSGSPNPSPAPQQQQHSQTDLDLEAAKFHFTDVISPPDSLVPPLATPQLVKMTDASLSDAAAYMLAGNIQTVEPPRRGGAAGGAGHTSPPNTSASSSDSLSSSTSRRNLEALVHQFQLLIRLPRVETDMCVRVNVPLKEFARAGQAVSPRGSGDDNMSPATQDMISQELGYAREILAHVVNTLAVREWGLFGL